MRRTTWWAGAMAGMLAGWATAAETNGPAAHPLAAAVRAQADVRWWAQVNRAALYADNGTESEWFHVDNDSMPSRFGVAGDYKPAVWGGWTFGGQIELGFKSDNSADVTFGGPDSEFKVDGRKIEAYAKNKKFGSLAVGQGDMASNGTAEEDLSGTYVAAYSQVRFAAAGLAFAPREAAPLPAADEAAGTNVPPRAPTVKEVFNNFDGLHRDDRIRYDAPVWRGLAASVSVAGEENFDAALRHSLALGAHKLASAVAFARKGAGVDQYSASCSLLLGCGLNFTAAIGGQDVEDERSPLSVYGKLGYKLDWFSAGPTMLAVDYSRNEDISQSDDVAESYAAVVVQRLEPLNAELYATARNYVLDRENADYDDLFVFMSGVNLRF